jgi:hypothetical protein
VVDPSFAVQASASRFVNGPKVPDFLVLILNKDQAERLTRDPGIIWTLRNLSSGKIFKNIL